MKRIHYVYIASACLAILLSLGAWRIRTMATAQGGAPPAIGGKGEDGADAVPLGLSPREIAREAVKTLGTVQGRLARIGDALVAEYRPYLEKKYAGTTLEEVEARMRVLGANPTEEGRMEWEELRDFRMLLRETDALVFFSSTPTREYRELMRLLHAVEYLLMMWHTYKYDEVHQVPAEERDAIDEATARFNRAMAEQGRPWRVSDEDIAIIREMIVRLDAVAAKGEPP